VKQAVDWAFACGMHVVLNDHWDDGWLDENITETVDPVINARMRSIWTQVATAFAGYDHRLLFAGANEPPLDSPAEMHTLMAYYQTFINAVRETGGNNSDRWLVLQSVSAPSWMNYLPADPTPGRVMMEYHGYTPTLFTLIHDDPSWGNSFYFWGEAYHYPGNPGRNATFGEEGDIDAEFQELKERYVDKGIPVLIGEFQIRRGIGPRPRIEPVFLEHPGQHFQLEHGRGHRRGGAFRPHRRNCASAAQRRALCPVRPQRHHHRQRPDRSVLDRRQRGDQLQPLPVFAFRRPACLAGGHRHHRHVLQRYRPQ
jgi:hypothetical protein